MAGEGQTVVTRKRDADLCQPAPMFASSGDIRVDSTSAMTTSQWTAAAACRPR
jgi:hypothetical protein